MSFKFPNDLSDFWFFFFILKNFKDEKCDSEIDLQVETKVK